MVESWVWNPQKRENPNNRGWILKVFDLADPLTRIHLEKNHKFLFFWSFLLLMPYSKAGMWTEVKCEKKTKTSLLKTCLAGSGLHMLDPCHWYSYFASPLTKGKGKVKMKDVLWKEGQCARACPVEERNAESSTHHCELSLWCTHLYGRLCVGQRNADWPSPYRAKI